VLEVKKGLPGTTQHLYAWERTYIFKIYYRLIKSRSDQILYLSQSNMKKKNLELFFFSRNKGSECFEGNVEKY
jgi:hypothetical protein